jgi:beta-galactosidase
MRKIINFNPEWTFIKKNVGFEEAAKTEGEKINLPHTWNGTDGQDGGGDYYRGDCFYVKKFTKPDLKIGEKAFIEFNGVNDEGEVYLNGVKIAQHLGGYATFRAELTPFLQEENTLVVRVSNKEKKNVYPQKADFTFYGGIYRDVNLIIVPSVHFDLLFLGGPGIRVDSTVQDKEGRCTIEAFPVNGGEVRVHLEDKEHKIVGEAKNKEEMIIKDVHLWDGVKDPYLYTAVAKLYLDGAEQDEVRAQIGFRFFAVDGKKGFFLNGRPYPLRGVSRHQDRPLKGNALAKEDHEEDMKLIREIGANTIRLAHYQHDEYFYTLCDQYGLVIWSEIPYISEHQDQADSNAVQQMKELIVQTYNHTSIVFRGLSNEITMKKAGKDRLKEHIILNDLVHKEDPHRLTTLASFAACSDFNKLNFIPDVFSYNFYFGWYVPGTFLNCVRLDFFHLLFPKHPVGLSEYGAEGMPNLHSEKPKRFDNTEEYQALYHEKMLKIISKRDYLWGTHVWNMFDFGADGRNQGGDPGKNHKGLITFDRKTKKDAFYIYKAYWSADPFVHLCSKRFINRCGKKTKIKVYSNQKEVTLFLNGEKVSSLKGEKVFIFSLPLKGKMDIKAVSGSCSDQMTILQVQSKDNSYICPKSNSYSWEKAKKK